MTNLKKKSCQYLKFTLKVINFFVTLIIDDKTLNSLIDFFIHFLKDNYVGIKR